MMSSPHHSLSPSIPFVKKVLVYSIFLFAIAGGRGFFLAFMIHGRYTLRSLLEDVLGLGLLMLCFHLFFFALNRFLRRFETAGNFSYKAMCGLVRLSFIVLVAFPGLLTFIQMHPQKIQTSGTPAQFQLEYSKVGIRSADYHLDGWFLPAKEPGKGGVVLAHGLNANKENFLYPAKLLHDLGYSVLTFDLRGHGDSDGRTFTFGIRENEDVKAAYDWLKEKLPGEKIFGLGYSAGAAAMLLATAKYGIFDKIVLDSTYSSIESVAKQKFLLYCGPLAEPMWQIGRLWAKLWSGVDLSTYDGAKAIKIIGADKVMLIHGTADQMIPVGESLKLRLATDNKVPLWLIENANHLQGLQDPSYSTRIREFFDH